MEDPRKLLASWNLIAGANEKWSDELIEALKAEAVSGRQANQPPAERECEKLRILPLTKRSLTA